MRNATDSNCERFLGLAGFQDQSPQPTGVKHSKNVEWLCFERFLASPSQTTEFY